MQTIQMTNKTPRTIEQIFIFPPGKDHGASRGKLAPNESRTMQLPAGNHEIYAVSEKIFHEDKTRTTPEASLTIELKSALDLIFYDSTNEPPGVQAANVRGIVFRMAAPKKTEEASDSEGPGVEAPPPPAPE